MQVDFTCIFSFRNIDAIIMELRHLQAFVKLTQTLNFSAAANELCITQSTLSATIKQLEDDLGVELFSRNSHGVLITEAGEQLLPFAQEALYQAENCVSRMYDLSNMKCGRLKIGVTHSFSLMMVEAILEFNKQYPGIELEIHYKTMGELLDKLLKHELDFVLSYKPSVASSLIESHVIFDDKLSFVVSKDNPISSLESVTVADIAKYRLALPAKGLQARNLLDEMCKAQGVELKAAMEFDLITPLLRLVYNSNFATVLSSASIQSHDYLKAIPIEAEHNLMEGSFHILKGSYRKKSAKEFIRILCETDTVSKLQINVL